MFKKCGGTCIRLDSIPALDRWTDGRTDGIAETIGLSRSACIAYWRAIKIH